MLKRSVLLTNHVTVDAFTKLAWQLASSCGSASNPTTSCTTITSANTPIDPLPSRGLRISYISPCWLDRRCVRRAQPAMQLAMLPAKQLRYDSRLSHRRRQLPPAPIIHLNYSNTASIFLASIDEFANELGDVASCLNIQLRSRGSCLVLEDECPSGRRHSLRYRVGCMVLPSLWTKCRCHDTRRRRVSNDLDTDRSEE